MKTFLILLAIGLAASDKLDRTYLPPPGAKYAGGRPEDLDAPLELPHPPGPGNDNQHLTGEELGFKPLNYGDKIPKTPQTQYPAKVPITTISYAFSQTTSLPPDYETTALPINPVTGVPFNFEQNIKLPGLNDGQIPIFDINVQPGSIIQNPQLDVNQGYGQPIDQPLNQYPGRNVNVPEEIVQIPGTNQGLTKYPGNQIPNNGQLGVVSTETVGNLYPGQNVINPGGSINNLDLNQGIVQYPAGQSARNPELLPSNASPQGINLQQNYDVNYPEPQGSYDGQPINVASPNEPINQYYQQQGPLNVEGQTNFGLVPIGSSNYNAPMSGLITRPERPQAAADRNAVILNYENVLYPNGYSYSYDTSNGIHADESGTVGNGTRAQGSYSYTGDDGKVYTVIYTADENGFQPRGDHLPTSPPIPEAIQKVIEQAAKDEAAGIFDDGSYDEEKYGDKKYQSPVKGRRPQKQKLNRIITKLNNEQDNKVKPIAGITDEEEGQKILLDQFNKNLPNAETRGKPVEEQNISKQPLNQEPYQDYDKNVTIGNKITVRPNEGSTAETAPNQLTKIDMQRNESSKPITVVTRRPEDQQNQFESNTYNNGVKDNNVPSDYPEYNTIKDRDFGDRITNVSGQPGALNADFDGNSGNGNQFSGEKPKGNLGSPSDRDFQHQNEITLRPIIPQDNSRTLSTTDYLKNLNNQPSSNQQDENGYYYQKPNTSFGQTLFPTRFSTQESSTTMRPDQPQNESSKRKPLRPFITPDVYNQNDRTYSPTTRRPFTTIGVTSPSQNTYTDYDDDDYESDQDIDNGRVNSTNAPVNKIDITARPYQSTQTSSPQYVTSSQRTNIVQKGIYPKGPIKNSSTATPGYTFGSTTPMPTSQKSRFETTDSPKRNKPYQRKPVISQILQSTPDAYNYGTNKPTSYSKTNTLPGYTASSVVPAFGTRASTPTTQAYPTSAYSPSQDYTGITGVPQSTVIGQGFTTRPAPADSSRNGYHYEPPKSDNSNSDFFNPRLVSSTLSPDTYQTIYPKGPFDFSNTSPVPSPPGRKGTFILTEPGNNLPTGTYQDNYNGPSTPGSTPVFGSLDFNPQTSTGNEYGPSRPVYSTTPSASTFGPTPNTFIPSETPGIPNQGYSTTYRPIQSVENGPLVDGFGRPIPTDQGTTFNGYPVSAQDPTRPPFQDAGYPGSQYDSRRPIAIPTTGTFIPIENIPVNDSRPGFNGNIGSTAYPIPYDETKVIGEDFSGPKQPQRYDPKTGYHY